MREEREKRRETEERLKEAEEKASLLNEKAEREVQVRLVSIHLFDASTSISTVFLGPCPARMHEFINSKIHFSEFVNAGRGVRG